VLGIYVISCNVHRSPGKQIILSHPLYRWEDRRPVRSRPWPESHTLFIIYLFIVLLFIGAYKA
jgi:hypothetical protein